MLLFIHYVITVFLLFGFNESILARERTSPFYSNKEGRDKKMQTELSPDD